MHWKLEGVGGCVKFSEDQEERRSKIGLSLSIYAYTDFNIYFSMHRNCNQDQIISKSEVYYFIFDDSF